MHDRFDQRTDAIFHDVAGILAEIIAVDPGIEISLGFAHRSRVADPDRHIRAAGALEEFCRDFRPVARVAGLREDELQVQFRAAQQKGQCPGIIDVGADIRIQDHRYAPRQVWGGRGRCRQKY